MGTWAAVIGVGAAGVGGGGGDGDRAGSGLTTATGVERCEGPMHGGAAPRFLILTPIREAQRDRSKCPQKGSCLGKPRPRTQGPNERKGTLSTFDIGIEFRTLAL